MSIAEVLHILIDLAAGRKASLPDGEADALHGAVAAATTPEPPPPPPVPEPPPPPPAPEFPAGGVAWQG